jgi:urease gamma subunit
VTKRRRSDALRGDHPTILAREDVMKGVPEIQIGTTVPGGAKLATVHDPIT